MSHADCHQVWITAVAFGMVPSSSFDALNVAANLTVHPRPSLYTSSVPSCFTKRKGHYLNCNLHIWQLAPLVLSLTLLDLSFSFRDISFFLLIPPGHLNSPSLPRGVFCLQLSAWLTTFFSSQFNGSVNGFLDQPIPKDNSSTRPAIQTPFTSCIPLEHNIVYTLSFTMYNVQIYYWFLARHKSQVFVYLAFFMIDCCCCWGRVSGALGCPLTLLHTQGSWVWP